MSISKVLKNLNFIFIRNINYNYIRNLVAIGKIPIVALYNSRKSAYYTYSITKNNLEFIKCHINKVRPCNFEDIKSLFSFLLYQYNLYYSESSSHYYDVDSFSLLASLKFEVFIDDVIKHYRCH